MPVFKPRSFMFCSLNFRQFNDGKKRNSNAKSILSLGGVGDAYDMAFRTLSKKDNTFRTFAKHALGFLRDNGFDGLNINWLTFDEPSIQTTFPKMIKVIQVCIDIH